MSYERSKRKTTEEKASTEKRLKAKNGGFGDDWSEFKAEIDSKDASIKSRESALSLARDLMYRSIDERIAKLNRIKMHLQSVRVYSSRLMHPVPDKLREDWDAIVDQVDAFDRISKGKIKSAKKRSAATKQDIREKAKGAFESRVNELEKNEKALEDVRSAANERV